MSASDTFVGSYGTYPVERNTDSYTTNAILYGSCALTGRPLTGNTSGTFTAASTTAGQLRYDLVSHLGAQAVEALESVRPASRFPRRISTGFSWSDDMAYAPYDYVHPLFATTTTITGTATGYPADTLGGETVYYDGIVSISGVTHYTGTHTEPAALPAHKSDFIYVDTTGTRYMNVETLPDSDLLYVTGAEVSGTYNVSTHVYYLTKTGAFESSGSLRALWRTESTEVVRQEPVTASIRYNTYPEDDIDTTTQVGVADAVSAAGSEHDLVDEFGIQLVDEFGVTLSWSSDLEG